jgi:flavodoxin
VSDRAKDVINMRVLVVYESMYQNTHAVASNIADGLRGTHEVTLARVVVTKLNTLADGESSRARRWGATLADLARQTERQPT